MFTEVKLFVCMFCKAELLFIEVAQFCKQATRLLLKDMSHAGLGSVPKVHRLQIGKFKHISDLAWVFKGIYY